MSSRILVVALGVAVGLWACGDWDEGPDGGASARWVKSLDAEELVGLARDPDGVVVLDSSGSLRAFSADGALRWKLENEAATPYDGYGFVSPELLATDAGLIYLKARLPPDATAVGGRAIDCSQGPTIFCEVLAAIDALGEVRWVEVLSVRDAAPDHDWTVVGERVVVFSRTPTLRGRSAEGNALWEVTPRLPDGGFFSNDTPPPVLQADGADALWLVSEHVADGGCDRGVRFAWLRFSAADGEQTMARWSCEGAGLPLDDGRVAYLREDEASPTLESIDGVEPWRLPLPDGYGAVPVEGGQLVLYAAGRDEAGVGTGAGIGPLALTDASGVLRWQWPGELHDGAMTPQPSGLCRGLVAGAPDGDLYVASQACAGARALLGASGSQFDDAGGLVARIHVYGGQPARCGNGWLDTGEACDQQDFPPVYESSPLPMYLDSRDCTTWLDTSGWKGEVSCTADCKIDTEACVSTCGNGRLDLDEQCDGSLRSYMEDATCPGTRTITACIDCRYDSRYCPNPPPP